jgi:hypothetical protein
MEANANQRFTLAQELIGHAQDNRRLPADRH